MGRFSVVPWILGGQRSHLMVLPTQARFLMTFTFLIGNLSKIKKGILNPWCMSVCMYKTHVLSNPKPHYCSTQPSSFLVFFPSAKPVNNNLMTQ